MTAPTASTRTEHDERRIGVQPGGTILADAPAGLDLPDHQEVTGENAMLRKTTPAAPAARPARSGHTSAGHGGPRRQAHPTMPSHDRRAACRDSDPELFFPVGTGGPAALQTAEAKKVCRRCPLRDACLEWALETGESGVLGGTSEDERRAMRRSRPRVRTS